MRKIKNKRIILAALICLVFVGVVAAQIWSNTVTITTDVEEPSFTLALVDAPTSMIMSIPAPFNLTVTRTFEGDFNGYFMFVVETLPSGANYENISISNATETVFFSTSTVYLEFAIYGNTLSEDYWFALTIYEAHLGYEFSCTLVGDIP